jgi:hypothetical protein
MQNYVRKHKLFEGVHLGLEDRELRRPSCGGLVDRAQHRGALGVYEVHERGVLAHHWRWKVHLRDGNFGHAGAVARRLGIPVPERLVGRAREGVVDRCASCAGWTRRTVAGRPVVQHRRDVRVRVGLLEVPREVIGATRPLVAVRACVSALPDAGGPRSVPCAVPLAH